MFAATATPSVRNVGGKRIQTACGGIQCICSSKPCTLCLNLLAAGSSVCASLALPVHQARFIVPYPHIELHEVSLSFLTSSSRPTHRCQAGTHTHTHGEACCSQARAPQAKDMPLCQGCSGCSAAASAAAPSTATTLLLLSPKLPLCIGRHLEATTTHNALSVRTAWRWVTPSQTHTPASAAGNDGCLAALVPGQLAGPGR
jgi:hypothetical protein